ncbi:DUF3565 domain-containing protein [Arhodomonas aquaeolei]|uniref:DUF3565 domain-containing protein n=1 Tax=Arhodomonas aquaeolei TaxID=2369 RepID=UPI0003796C3A|nr:DUF3565 domain-containing protein [Arhodomonas aquaeolei]
MNHAATVRGFRRDAEGHWVMELACGHTQHVRHLPPWQNRPWVTTETGRRAMLGRRVDCGWCARARERDARDDREEREQC